METKKQLNNKAVAILQRLANGDTVNGISTPTFKVPNNIKLLGTSFKIKKANRLGVLSSVLYLAPSDSSGIMRKGNKLSVCCYATKYCRAACLGLNAGKMVYKTSFNSRLWKTALFFTDSSLFMQILESEIRVKAIQAKAQGKICAIRLNGTSDIPFVTTYNLADRFENVQFYEYTKNPTTIERYKGTHKNYHLTYSANSAAISPKISKLALDKGLSVAAIVNEPPVCEQSKIDLSCMVLGYFRHGTYIENGDDSDARFLDRGSKDGSGTIVYLKIKGGQKVAKTMGRDMFNV
tara:strand:- start:341 stop:1219 length:879 start_codon:yes stop_codon:yes gene_type:complete